MIENTGLETVMYKPKQGEMGVTGPPPAHLISLNPDKVRILKMLGLAGMAGGAARTANQGAGREPQRPN